MFNHPGKFVILYRMSNIYILILIFSNLREKVFAKLKTIIPHFNSITQTDTLIFMMSINSMDLFSLFS